AADARGVQQLEDRAGTDVGLAVAVDGHQPGHVRLVEVGGYAPLEPRRDQGPGRVGGQDPLPAKVAEERAQAGELPRRRALLEALTVEAGQEGAQEKDIHVPWVRLPAELRAQV